LFRLSLCLITFGGRSAHLAYLVNKSGRKTSINHQVNLELTCLTANTIGWWFTDTVIALQ